jgi:hypothetical protein
MAGSIYEKSTRELIRDFVSSFIPPESGDGFSRKPLADGGYFTRQECVKWFSLHYPELKKGTVTAHLMLLSTNAHSRIHHHLRADGSDDLLYQIDRSMFRRYDPKADPSPIYVKRQTASADRGSTCKRAFPRPSVEQVNWALRKWDTLDGYVLQESCLRKLFEDTYPRSTDMDDVLAKVCCLNDFYSTNIFSPVSMAKHIVALNIDQRLSAGDLTLVNDLSHVMVASGKVIHFYSFATKYCSHHQPLKFPIYDYFVDTMLLKCKKTDAFARFSQRDIKDYPTFYEILLSFREFYGLGRFSLKQLDQYLWLTGKEYFPKTYK